MIGTRKQWNDSLQLGIMQFLVYGICTVSWRAVAQANVFAAVLADTSFASINFFVVKKISQGKDEASLVPWIGYTIGGVLGTVTVFYFSLWVLGK